MNPKLQKVTKEIERTADKIAELQTLLPELEKQKTELENLEIVRLVRCANVTPGELDMFLNSLRVKPAQTVAPNTIPNNTILTKEETDFED
jgi:hypothetical protein